MGFTLREIWSLVHGAGFGTALLLLFPAVIAGVYFLGRGGFDERVTSIYLRGLVVGAWITAALALLTDIVGTYLPYPWYRAKPPAGVTNLRDFPQSYLLSRPDLAIWHNVAMEWKEYLGWAVPMLCTAAAYILLVYGKRLIGASKLRKAVMTFLVIAFVAASITGYLGIFITKLAPVR